MIYTIYKLCCDDTDKIYIGSTRNRKERVRKHRDDSKVKDSLINRTIREFGGWDNWRMVDLEEYTCDTKRQAEKREEEWRVELKADLNSQRCYTTWEEQVQRKKKNDKNRSPPEMIICECGKRLNEKSRKDIRHLKSKTHMKWMETQQQTL